MDVVGVVTIIGTGTGLVGAVVTAAVKITRHIGSMTTQNVAHSGAISKQLTELQLEIQRNFRTVEDCQERHTEVADIRKKLDRVKTLVGEIRLNQVKQARG